ncbi:MAG: hypothetical protein Q8R76_03755 [Candidatus Omnitrophota bacterium]|nr:hypothetical protein [Candidatus Omnitrophota bacterium]
MTNINDQLLKSLLDRMEAEYGEVAAEVAQRDTKEARKFAAYIGEKLEELKLLRTSLSYLASFSGETEQPDLRQTLRTLKLDLRFFHRRWKRYRITEDRTRKIYEKKHKTSGFAA